MRLRLTLLGGSLLDLTIGEPDSDDEQTMRPPFGFAGGGSGLVERSYQEEGEDAAINP